MSSGRCGASCVSPASSDSSLPIVALRVRSATHWLRKGAHLLRRRGIRVLRKRKNPPAKNKKGRAKKGDRANHPCMHDMKSIVVDADILQRLARHPFTKGM